MHSQCPLCCRENIKIFNLQKAENEENCEVCEIECFSLLCSLLDVLEKVNLEYVSFTEVFLFWVFCLVLVFWFLLGYFLPY